MEQQEIIEQRLWEYIDQTASPSEAAEIEKLIAENAQWKKQYHQLLEVNQLLSATELDAPSLRFTKNVMEEIARLQITPATKNYINNKVIWGIGWFFILAITGFVIFAIGQVDWSAGATTENPLGFDLNAVDFSKVFDNSFMNAFMMINTVLGLMLLERYLEQKKKKLVS